MKNKKVFSRILSLICVFSVFGGAVFSLPAYATNTEFNGKNINYNLGKVETWNLQKYSDYISANQGDLVDTQIDINIKDAVNLVSAKTEDNKIIISENGQVDFSVSVNTSGYYNIGVTYSSIEDADGYEPSMEITLALNGKIPFEKAKNIELSRCYIDDKNEDSDFFKSESNNDIPFVQKQQCLKRTAVLEDSTGYTEGYLKFYFEKGDNSITVFSERGDTAIYSLKLFNAENNISYKEYLNKYNNYKDTKKNKTVVIRAELPEYRSNYTIVPSTDTTSVATTPNHISEERLNVIGGTKWQAQGEWLAYNLNIQEDGWYKIAVRYRNNVYPGTYSNRRVYIDGEIPFKEAENIKFIYTTSWKTQAFGNEETAFSFYLTKGTHLLTIEAVTGDMAAILSRVQGIMQSLNSDYMQILTFTGSTPDDTRDYNFEKLIPDVLGDMKLQMVEIQELIQEIKSTSSGMGDNITVLNKTALVLEKMVDDPDLIVNHFSEFQDNITALGTWVQTYSNQPLELDSIYLVDNSEEIPSGKASFFENFVFRLKKFFNTFINDYNSTSGFDEEKQVEVWIASSSEQAKIIQQMAEETFYKDSGIFPNIQLVASSSLLPSVLAKTGPDVYLGGAENLPIDYAIRSAVLPLNKCNDFDNICKRFSPAALLPLTFNGVTYALPESHNFPVMLYRKDIFDQLNLKVPETWDDFYKLIPVLQNNNMMIGYTWDSAFSTFLYQRGGQFYTDDQKKTNMDSNTAMLAFKDACELFTLYDLPVTYSLPTRFRTGEMPIAIADYLTYNTLEVSAPEIKGLWGMTLVPGTAEADGTINHSVASTVTACIMLNGAKVDNAWEFMCWWTSADVQGKYAVEMESVYGPSAKIASSNVEALSLMSWDKDFYNIIDGQRKYACGTPQIPGGYYTSRALSFAFNNVYNGVSDSETALEDELSDLNAEIRRKRKEFGLDY